MKRFGVFQLLIILFSITTNAHPGRTDANGGHYDHKNGGYHYHNANTYSNNSYYSSQNNNYNYKIDYEKLRENENARKIAEATRNLKEKPRANTSFLGEIFSFFFGLGFILFLIYAFFYGIGEIFRRK